MKQLFIKLFISKTVSKDDLSNEAVDLALAWGKDWLKPIQTRLSKKFDYLSEAELDAFNQESQEVLKEGFDFIYNTLEKAAVNRDSINQNELQTSFDLHMVERFSWINKANLGKIFSQGLYYTWKEGHNECLH